MQSTSPAGPPPKGFDIRQSADGAVVIAYRPTGLGCITAFFVVWLSGWTFFCVILLFQVLTVRSESAPSLAFASLFWVSDLLVLGFALWYLRSLTIVTFLPDRLLFERSFYRIRVRREFLRSSIHATRQVRDGGEGEDSFPTWGLVLDGPGFKILTRQPKEKSEWLGQIAAEWAGVEFRSSAK